MGVISHMLCGLKPFNSRLRGSLAAVALIAMPLGCTSPYDRTEAYAPPPAYLDARDLYRPQHIGPPPDADAMADFDSGNYDTGDYVTAERNAPDAQTFGGAYYPETAYPGASDPAIQSDFYYAGSPYPYADPFYNPYRYGYGIGYGYYGAGASNYYGHGRERDYFYRRDDRYGDQHARDVHYPDDSRRDYTRDDNGRDDGGRYAGGDPRRDSRETEDRTPRELSPQPPTVVRSDREPRTDSTRRDEQPRIEARGPTRDAGSIIAAEQARERQAQQRDEQSRRAQAERARSASDARSERNDRAPAAQRDEPRRQEPRREEPRREEPAIRANRRGSTDARPVRAEPPRNSAPRQDAPKRR